MEEADRIALSMLSMPPTLPFAPLDAADNAEKSATMTVADICYPLVRKIHTCRKEAVPCPIFFPSCRIGILKDITTDTAKHCVRLTETNHTENGPGKSKTT